MRPIVGLLTFHCCLLISFCVLADSADMQEASKKCQAKLEEYWMNDGESWFTKEITRGTMTQVRQLDTTKFENQLGLADKLNGIEWQGRIITQSAAYRSFPSQYDPSKWGVWLSPGYKPHRVWIHALERGFRAHTSLRRKLL